jgi:hypothetical protein
MNTIKYISKKSSPKFVYIKKLFSSAVAGALMPRCTSGMRFDPPV